MKTISFHYKKNTFQMLQLSAVTENMSRLFSEKNIPLILLKGPALGHMLYDDISLRPSSVLDFLIPIEKIEMPEKLVTEQAYEKQDDTETVHNACQLRHHYVTYFHPH